MVRGLDKDSERAILVFRKIKKYSIRKIVSCGGGKGQDKLSREINFRYFLQVPITRACIRAEGKTGRMNCWRISSEIRQRISITASLCTTVLGRGLRRNRDGAGTYRGQHEQCRQAQPWRVSEDYIQFGSLADGL